MDFVKQYLSIKIQNRFKKIYLKNVLAITLVLTLLTTTLLAILAIIFDWNFLPTDPESLLIATIPSFYYFLKSVEENRKEKTFLLDLMVCFFNLKLDEEGQGYLADNRFQWKNIGLTSNQVKTKELMFILDHCRGRFIGWMKLPRFLSSIITK
jgi:hypothetical protein